MNSTNDDLPVGITFLTISTGVALYLQIWVVLAILVIVWALLIAAML